MVVGIRQLTTWHLLSAKFGTNFADNGGLSVGTQATQFCLGYFKIFMARPMNNTNGWYKFTDVSERRNAFLSSIEDRAGNQQQTSIPLKRP
jgi:hypothetical protein